MQMASVEAHVTPLESENFALSHAEGEPDHPAGVQMLPLRGSEEGPCFLDRVGVIWLFVDGGGSTMVAGWR